jgi:hypothetical protein
MKIYQGLIEDITNNDPYNTGHNKKIVTIKESDNQTSFIEFLGDKMLNLLNEYKIYDQVIIAAVNKGSVSAKGLRFNNLIAKSIKKSELCKTI